MIERLIAPISRALAVKIAARRIERRRLAKLGPVERGALDELRRCGLALAWDVPTIAGAMAKALRLSHFDATARTRAGLALALRDGALPRKPHLADLVAAAFAGARR